jgi:hypothetical protein
VLAFVRDHPPFPADLRPLAAIGVTVDEGDLSVPLPELIDPTSTFNPLADASTVATGDEAIAAVEFDVDDVDMTALGTEELFADAGAGGDDALFDTSSNDLPAFEAPELADAGFDDAGGFA